MINNKEYYTELFSTGVPEMEKLIDTALEDGGDYADLYFENTSYRDLYLRDGKVSSGGFHVDFGVGIRVLKGEKTGYAYSESTDMPSLENAAKAAAAISRGIKVESEPKPTFPFKGKPNPAADRYPIVVDWRGCTMDSFVPVLTKLETLIRSKESRVVKVMAMLSTSVSDVMMFNSKEQISQMLKQYSLIEK